MANPVDVQHVAAQPVELPHHHDIALADLSHQVGKAWTVVARAGHRVRERLCDTRLGKRVVLLVERLGDRTHANISDPLTLDRSLRLASG